MTEFEDDHQIGYQALPRGVPIVTTDGITIGTVAKVLDNAREHIFDGIVMRTDRAAASSTPPKSPASPRAGQLTIDAPRPRLLAEYRGTLGAMETNLRRTGARWRRRLGR